MMKSKKESSIINIFVYLLIALLVLIIIIPPITRIVFKESNDDINKAPNESTSNNTATALTCSRTVNVGTMTYNINIVSNYGDNILNRVTFTYETPTVIDQTVTDNPILNEINTIRQSGLVTEDTTDNIIKFTLTKESKEKDPTNQTLDGYFNDLTTQQANLEALGYACQTLTA